MIKNLVGGVIIVILFVSLSLIPLKSFAATYYVDATSGSNSNNGTDSSTPWKTISKVNGSSFSPGDSILFKKGEIWREKLTMPSSGTSGHPIIFGAFGTGANPLLNGADVITGWTQDSPVTTETFTDGSGAKPEGWWMLTETSGSRSDGNTTNNNTLSENGGTISRTTGPNTNVPFGAHLTAASSQSLRRADANLSAGFPAKNGVADGSFTAGLWIRPSDLSTTREFMGKGLSWYFGVGSNGVVTFTVFDDSYTPHNVSSAPGAIVLNTYAHVVGRWNQGTGSMKVFVNGVDVSASTVTSATMVQEGSNYFQVGVGPAFDAYFDGDVAEPFVFSSSLTDAQISDIYTGGLAGVTSNSIYYKSSSDPKQVFEDNARLSYKTLKANLVAGSYFWDSGATRLYIWNTNSLSPSTHTMETSAVRNQGIDFNGKSYINVDSIDVTKVGQAGYEWGVTTGSHDINVSHAVSSWNGQRGFRIGNIVYGTPTGDNNIITDSIGHDTIAEAFWIGGGTNNGCIRCEAYNNGKDIALKGYDGSGAGTGILVGSAAVNNFVIDSYIHDTYFNYPLMVEHENHASVTKPIGTIISGNLIVNNAATLWTAIDEQGQDSVYTNNIVYTTASGAGNLITLDSQGGVATGPTNTTLYNNTLYMGVTAFGDGLHLASASTVTFKNNIIFTENPGSCCGDIINVATGVTGFVSDYNNLPNSEYNWHSSTYPQNFADWKTTSSQDSHSFFSDPLFTNASSHNFTLLSSSPAIDTGLNLGSTYQSGLDPVSSWPSAISTLNQNTNGTGWEIGAYVFSNPNPIAVDDTEDVPSSGNKSGHRQNISHLLAPGVSAVPSLVSSLTQTLKLGSIGSQVKLLQQFLNNHGFILTTIGPGSPGQETELFGGFTKAALIKFQDMYASEILIPQGLTSGTGIFGSASLKKVQDLMR